MKNTRPTPTAFARLIDTRGGTPLLRQIYDGLREAILKGQLEPGGNRPATRALAAELGVARNTAVAAYDQLLAEGYLEGVGGSGTYVARDLPEGPPPQARPSRVAPARPGATTVSRR